jgi:hypothetical protein
MKTIGIVLLAWWVYVLTYGAISPSFVLVPRWLPQQRFLTQEFCEFKARQLRREGFEAIC